ncbi:MAG TPA: aldose epimerase family protein [Vicinamibacterales bacterium]|nr:aldose epimerase family protein [Vicinamibacterales bacterium]
MRPATGGLGLLAAGLAALAASSPQPGAAPGPPRTPRVTRAAFGRTPDGTAVDLFTIANGRGLELRAATYGGIIVALQAPDREGRAADIVLGYENLDGYLRDNSPYFGAIIGRYANRIGGARFALDGRTYRLAANDGPNHLHGGLRGFDKRVWTAEPFERPAEAGVVLRYTSPDGEEGYPGRLDARVTYTLTARNELIVDYQATADRPTIVNLTQHSYFNLTGATRDILAHVLWVDADRYTPVDERLIPTGELASVDGTPFDFRTPTPIGARIAQRHPQLRRGRGYDHNFVLNGWKPGGPPRPAARLVDPASGRTLEVATTEPGLQLYTGNFLDGRITGKGGRVYAHRWGLCLETQHFPDSPNRPTFPSTVLRPGEVYRSRTIFTFGVDRRP